VALDRTAVERSGSRFSAEDRPDFVREPSERGCDDDEVMEASAEVDTDMVEYIGREPVVDAVVGAEECESK